ncbi:MAG: AAA family ATPase, partial [Acidimicrobiaceae bacterium]|nr:AAA family ATPase [Acidimicrobiaceae bacterium]
ETDILHQAPSLQPGTEAGPSRTAGRSTPLPGGLLRAARRELIGRRRESTRLEGSIVGGADGVQVVLVVGEPGVGKTRLAAWAAESVAESGGLVLFGRCDEGLRVPYQPFVQALTAYVEGASTDELVKRLGSYSAPLARIVPGLEDRVPTLGAPGSLSPESERWHLFESVVNVLRSLSADRRVLLVVDDLQWAEPATLMLLRHVARASIKGLLVVATARVAGGPGDGPLTEVLADLSGANLVDVVRLEGLDQEEVAALVAHRLGHSPSEDFVAMLHAETGGNPFFVHELISHLADLGLLSSDRGWPTAAEVEGSGAPAGVRHVLANRIRQLSPSSADALVVASVAGSDFEARDVAFVAGADIVEVTALLDEASASGLIAETAMPGHYRFAHALVQHTLYQSTSRLRRAQLHWRMAQAISASPPTATSAALARLAYHYGRGVEAGDRVVALDCMHRAANQAFDELAFEAAISLYREALALCDRGADAGIRRFDLLAGVGDSAAALADYDQSHEAWLEAAEVAASAGDLERLAVAAGAYAMMSAFATHHEKVVTLCDRGLQLADAGDSPERAILTAVRAWVDAPDFRRLEPIREALAMARRIRDEVAEAAVLVALDVTLRGSSQTDELLAITDRLAEIGNTNLWGLSPTLLQRSVALARIQLGERTAAMTALEQAESLGRAQNRRVELQNVLMLKAGLMIASGDFPGAERLVDEARDVAGPDNRAVALAHAAQMLAIRAEQGQGQGVLDGWDELVENGFPGTAAWRTMFAALWADLGRLDQAGERLDLLAADDFAAIPRDWAFPLAVRYLPELCAQLDDSRRAAQLLPVVEPYRGQLLVVTIGTSIESAADRSLGQLYALLGRFDDASRHFDAAFQLETGMGFAPLAARTRFWHGRLMAQSGRGDRRRCRSLLEDASRAAAELGMATLQRQAADWLARLS